VVVVERLIKGVERVLVAGRFEFRRTCRQARLKKEELSRKCTGIHETPLCVEIYLPCQKRAKIKPLQMAKTSLINVVVAIAVVRKGLWFLMMDKTKENASP
jgi:hypothetical protein